MSPVSSSAFKTFSQKNTQEDLFHLAAETLGLTIKPFETLTRTRNGALQERIVLEITDGQKSFLTLGATTSRTSYLGMKIAVDKMATNSLLKKFDIPVTEQIHIHKDKDIAHALEKFGKIIIKPANSRAGKGVFSNVSSFQNAQAIYESLRKKYSVIVAENILKGNEYRVLVINGKVFAVAEYVPPFIVGDGQHSIDFLIKQENARRVAYDHHRLIKINTALHLNLKDAQLTTHTVLPQGQTFILHKAAPISNGGFIIDATEKIHPKNVILAERVAQLINLDVAGIDIITPRIEDPLESTGGAIIEINGGPDLDVHFNVHQGKPRNGAEAILREYFNL